MRLCDVIAKIAFGTRVAVRKDGAIQHIVYNDLVDINPWARLYGQNKREVG